MKFNLDQAKAQLKALSYSKDETVFLRSFYSSNDPRQAGDKGRKCEAVASDLPIEQIQAWQQQGRGVYFVVNGGGHRKSDVHQCRAVFYEHDNLDKAISAELWRGLELPEPTLQIDTGGKSIHSYWVLSEPISPALWVKLQADLLDFADADRALKDPSRVLRLAGAFHQATGEQSTIILNSGKRYSFGELRAIIPTEQGSQAPASQPAISKSDDEILLACLAVANRGLVNSGAAEGTRNKSGAALARDLIGTTQWLRGKEVYPNPRALFDNYCGRCSPPLEPREAEMIWRSAEGDNPGPSLSEDKLENCLTAATKQPKAKVAGSQATQAPGETPQGKTEDGTEFLQKACAALYPSDEHWICFGGVLHQWEGSYYKPVPDEAEYPRLREFCNRYAVKKINKSTEGEFSTYPFAKPGFVKQILEWQKQGCTVTEINPPGLNCRNGVLTFHWEGKTLKTELVPHDPAQHLYTGEPLVIYNPKADPTEYQQLMECLEDKPREIFLKTIAASFDVATVRKHKGRGVKAVFLKGDGSNGKDTLRVLCQLLMGHGRICGVSVTDWQAYDSGRKFGVYSLRGSSISWPSENVDVGRIDQLKGLRAAITGDPIDFERKYLDSIQESPQAVFLFNVNEAPDLVAHLEATKSRWGFIPFNKTYARNPVPGQLQADSRYKEDPEFIQEKLLPAFLNDLIKHLQLVVTEGIDYSATDHYLEEIQRESCHLLQFCQDTGLVANPDGKETVKELWERLRAWYIEQGTLIVEPPTTAKGKEKLTWVDQPKRSDKNVRGVNQVAARFLEVFPKAKKLREQVEDSKNYHPVIHGISFKETPQESCFGKTAQDAQDGQDRGSETQTGQEVQQSLPVSQLPKIDPKLPKTKAISAHDEAELPPESGLKNLSTGNGHQPTLNSQNGSRLGQLPPKSWAVEPEMQTGQDSLKPLPDKASSDDNLGHLDHLGQLAKNNFSGGLQPGQPCEVKHPTLGWENGYIYRGKNINGLAIVELAEAPGHPETYPMAKVRACEGGQS
ncbi:hypothetical protein RIF25_05000 [Thermosynechococcaceae cyanobacterium BACA0444]|uniref:SF3 helicase domain-containing protein n=1 Tax=Pseudocalidococcus azoricus BACA0444 TaxID=2918990 RepID=A0AAE4JWH6_9CYAN|nr:hypothetical protein [Pseudocalidococcus azoricus]MDS3860158.1 hypothetical protein [Pseudocalidococcus azoricus BACA0444]